MAVREGGDCQSLPPRLRAAELRTGQQGIGVELLLEREKETREIIFKR